MGALLAGVFWGVLVPGICALATIVRPFACAGMVAGEER